MNVDCQEPPAKLQTNNQPEDEKTNLSSQEEDAERDDQEYLEWKGWKERARERTEAEEWRKSDAVQKTHSWALYRECTRLLEENKTRWMERQEDEKQRKLQEDKEIRLEDGRKKREKLLEKIKKTKETNPEKLRRLEEERKNAGKLKMRSELWRQRREKDGKLLRVRKEIERTQNISSHEEQE